LRELTPLVRYRHRPDHRSVQEILNRKRDISLSIDIRLQARLASILEKRVLASGAHNGAAVVIDPATGDLLASATYPWKDVANTKELIFDSDEIPQNSNLSNNLLDRPRYGLYPPGSSFKLVTAMAAFKVQKDAEMTRFECKRLPDGRVGNYVRGWGKPVRDDIMDKSPHGIVDMGKGLTVSCNAYFAQLGTYLCGPQALLDAADLFGIKVASPNTAAQLKDALPQASYGQGQVVVSPLQMARVAGAIGNRGQIVPIRIVLDEEPQDAKTCVTEEQAMKLAEYMRRVVTEGTGKEAGKALAPIAGKTGTAELNNKPAHAWFVGFSPAGSKMKKIAFGILIENGRYGGRAAAPAAPEIVNAAVELGLISKE
jgi:peptidoglycan glycosyltransferase